jgi:DNA-binding SARP family transcriptional activator
VRVHVLGEFTVEGIDAGRLGSRKARQLLKVLALGRGQPIRVERLISCLWSDGETPERPEQEIAVLVSRLRAVIGRERLVRVDAGYRLDLDWLDLDAVSELAAEADRHLAGGSFALARTAAESALHLVQGPVLPDEPDAAWVTGERAAAERLFARLRHIAARAALLTGDCDAAFRFAAKALEADRYDETSLRLAMRAHVGAGRAAAALALYATFREWIVDDLGADPSAETEALHLAILRQEALPPEELPGTPQERALSRRRPGAQSPLPGRDAEMGAFDVALERATGGTVQFLMVEGEAGIGKSRLLDAWGDRARATGCIVLQSKGHELERTLSLQPIFDALDAYLLGSTPSAVIFLLGHEHALLAPLLRSSPPAPGAATTDPVEGQAALFAATLAVFERLAARAPVVLLLDDLHLADQATISWLHFVERRASAARLLVVGAVRPEEAVPLPATSRLTLGPLDLAATELIVGADRATELYARSSGHPLFLTELAATDDGSLPGSLREAIGAQCERAGPEAAAVLRTASLLGTTVDLDLLAALADTSPLDVLSYLEEGVRRRLLEERHGTFAFRHQLVREALGSALGIARQTLVHREAARALAGRPDPDPLPIAYHARLGGERALASASYAAAATQAAERFDHAESERLLDLAIDLDDNPSLVLRRAQTRILRGNYTGAEDDALAALNRGAGALALEQAGWAAYFHRDFAAACRYADHGARLSTGTIRSRCLVLAGRARHMGDDPPAAERSFQEAIALANEPMARVGAEVFLSQLRVHQGMAEEAIELASVARYAPTAHGMQVVFGYYMTMVHALGTLGRTEEALSAIDAWEAEIDRTHITRFRQRPVNYRAWILRGLGHLAEADALNHAALEASRRPGSEEPAAQALLDLADGRLQSGDPDAALAYLAEAAPLYAATPAGCWRLQLRDRLLRGRAALARGELVEAQALAHQVQRDAERVGARRYVDLASLLGVRAAAALGEEIDLHSVETVLQGLNRHAGMEAWWLCADVARDTQSNAFWDLAESHAAHLADQAGVWADSFRRYADHRLALFRQ